MEKFYTKEVNRITDAIKGIDCVNCSTGAVNQTGFARILRNTGQFKNEAIIDYNDIILAVTKQLGLKVFFIVYEEKDCSFTLTEKHLSIWKNFNEIKGQKADTFYIGKNKIHILKSKAC